MLEALCMPSDEMPESEGERALASHAFFQSIKTLSSVCYRASEAEDDQLQRLLSELPGAGVAVVDLDAYDDFRKLPIRPRETLLLAGTRETLSLAAGMPFATVGYGALAEGTGCGLTKEHACGNMEGLEEPESVHEKEPEEEPEGVHEKEPEEESEDMHEKEPEEELEGVHGKEPGEEPEGVHGKEPEEEPEGVHDKESDGEMCDTERHMSDECAPDATLPQADLLVEGFEEVDVQLLDRIMKRAQGLPWITVVTKRCVLREITLGDMDDLFALYAQPGITDYTEPLYEREEEEQYTRDYITHMYRFYGYGMWLVFSKESGALVGRAGFSHQDMGNEIVLEMGYIVGVPYQRQGYATEICEKLIEFARTNLSAFRTLNCFVEPKNAASHGLMEKLGFARRGPAEIQGKEMVWYEMGL